MSFGRLFMVRFRFNSGSFGRYCNSPDNIINLFLIDGNGYHLFLHLPINIFIPLPNNNIISIFLYQTEYSLDNVVIHRIFLYLFSMFTVFTNLHSLESIQQQLLYLAHLIFRYVFFQDEQLLSQVQLLDVFMGFYRWHRLHVQNVPSLSLVRRSQLFPLLLHLPLIKKVSLPINLLSCTLYLLLNTPKPTQRTIWPPSSNDKFINDLITQTNAVLALQLFSQQFQTIVYFQTTTNIELNIYSIQQVGYLLF